MGSKFWINIHFYLDPTMDFIKISKNSLSLLNGRSVNQNNVKHERIWLLFNVILYISQPIREIFLYFFENGLMVHRWTILPWSVHSLLSRWGTQIMAAVLTFSIHIYGQLLESVDCYIPKHNKDREICCSSISLTVVVFNTLPYQYVELS